MPRFPTARRRGRYIFPTPRRSSDGRSGIPGAGRKNPTTPPDLSYPSATACAGRSILMPGQVFAQAQAGRFLASRPRFLQRDSRSSPTPQHQCIHHKFTPGGSTMPSTRAVWWWCPYFREGAMSVAPAGDDRNRRVRRPLAAKQPPL